MEKHGFLTVNYDDGDSSSYKSIELSFGDGEVRLFDSGDPLIDWYDYFKYIYNGDAVDDDIVMISHSSSVDHWFMDTDDYLERYILINENNTYEFIDYEDTNKLSIPELQKMTRCVVHKDMKSFQELKDYYKLNKK